MALFTGLLIFASTARGGDAPDVCGDSTGPDVVISTINSANSYAPFNGIAAFSFGYTCCNFGDEEVIFIDYSNQHPVFGQNLYRLKEGRFEQLGMGWMLHGFVAVNQNACSCGCIEIDGQHLGVGCSNPESASIQGVGDLGPRFEMNPVTGYFPFPSSPGTPEEGGWSIYRRIQVHLGDLNPNQQGGGEYFAETIVIAPDDAESGNQRNNASYRPVTINFSNNNASATLVGNTTCGKPAIFAWREQDPDVMISDAHAVNDGKFYLAAKVNYVGNGFWQYEYALNNSYSERAAGSFSIPRPAETIVESIGFHDVDYHSGEPFESTDWSTTISNESISWSTESFEDNPNANALRWGTLYNFRFRMNRAPVSSLAAIELFKPGPENSLPISTLIPNPSTPDCNLNNRDDTCDLSCGTPGGQCDEDGCGLSFDYNIDGIPDECQVIGDYDSDNDLDLDDFAHWGGCARGPSIPFNLPSCSVFDVNSDLNIDLSDLRAILNSFGNASP